MGYIITALVLALFIVLVLFINSVAFLDIGKNILFTVAYAVVGGFLIFSID
jgi:hypothetical protein